MVVKNIALSVSINFFQNALQRELSITSFRHILVAQRQPFRGVLRKRSTENMQQIYRSPYRSVVSIQLLSKFIEITLRHGCFPVNLLHIFRTLFSKNTSGRRLLVAVVT